jgi:hypothetical protein
METATPSFLASETNVTPTGKRYNGCVVYLYAFDIAYELARQPQGELLGQPLAQFSVDGSRRNPKHLFFYRPLMIRMPPQERLGPHGPVRVERTVKLLPVGGISISVRVPFAVDHVEDLVAYHDLEFNNGPLHREVRHLAEEVRNALAPCLIRPVDQIEDEEAYTVFCLEAPMTDAERQPLSAEGWLRVHRRQVASLLTQEPDLTALSAQEAAESTDRHLSYYQNDLVVVDWDAALVVDERCQFEEALYIVELANLQLAELEAYDRLLDTALDRAYRDLSTARQRNRSGILRELREIRIDLARLGDELSNITKFFGDWHLARVYGALSARFHLPDWHRAIDGKLQTLDHLYEILKHEQTNRWMLILETTIVLLFIIDVVVLVSGLK